MDEKTQVGVQAYEAPAIEVLGSVAELTQNHSHKRWGSSDGWQFTGGHVHNVSP
jgi:hypothetical protein